ncbi:hypothetical protein Xbed_02251 [Xenorhabdus beddingii]|uniref:ImpA N-terminal domain-containing protein n=1 Tax=Xenorhabdus beddingii TaxID=40578 RepID=A0A1Y2SKU7_9GAMM|nr:type VI secretion system protein TssA [Xenorhabdus beddingii]OTA19571.1 hypothetical protein Xbed_02251 [Xenorhabdus beddingii]
MNITTLLAPISAESPCGENLEYDDEFLALEQILIEKPEQQFGDVFIPAEPPNWLEVEKQAIHLLSRTKDLRIIIALVQSWLNLRGLCGYADGLNLLRQSLKHYWEDVWPRLEFNGEYDLLPRLNMLATIEDGSPCTIKAQRTIILKSVSSELSLQEVYSLLNGSVSEIKGYTGGRTRLIEELKQQANAPEIKAIITLREQLIALMDIIRHHLSDNHVPELPQFMKQLNVVIGFCPASDPREPGIPENSTHAELPGSATLIKQDSSVGQTTSSSSITTTPIVNAGNGASFHWLDAEVNNRDEARILLEKAKMYFRKHEPSHPAPMMIDRIQRLIDRDFINIIHDLSPESLNQLEVIFGRQDGSDPNNFNPSNSDPNNSGVD